MADVECRAKRSGFPGEEKETVADRKDGARSAATCTTTTTLPLERVSAGSEALNDPSAPGGDALIRVGRAVTARYPTERR